MSNIRLSIIAGMFFLSFLILVGRLAYMQLLCGEEYEEIVERKRRSVEVSSARRGTIYDRNGNVLATDSLIFDISFILPEIDPQTVIVPLVARRTGLSEEGVSQRIASLISQMRHLPQEERMHPQLLVENVNPRAASYISQLSRKFPDRYGSLLVKESGDEKRDLCIIVPKIDVLDETLRRIAELTGVAVESLLDRVGVVKRRISSIESRYQRQYELGMTHLLWKNVSRKVVEEVEIHHSLYPGIVITTRQGRVYPNGSVASHILGYLRQISREEYERLRAEGRIVSASVVSPEDIDVVRKSPYFIDDMVGATGIEAQYDSLLRGNKGAHILQRDNKTLEVEVLDEIAPEDGKSIYLTIDIELQKETEKALLEAGIVGAAVVISANSGEILAMASNPSFDLNTFRKPEEYRRLREYPYPMLNRASSSALAPGSGFKIVTAVAALEEKVVSKSLEYFCRGYYKVPNAFRCWKRTGHGNLDISGAIEQSCNCYFHFVGEKLGQEKLRSWATLFGFGEKTGLDIPGEVAGLLPSPEWKTQRAASVAERVRDLNAKAEGAEIKIKEMIEAGAAQDEIISAQAELTDLLIQLSQEKERFEALKEESAWVPGDTRNLAIGQGYILVTPLQMASMAAIVASGGKVFRPHLVAEPGENYLVREVRISEETLQIVRTAMLGVVESPRGTAHGFGLDKYGVCAKTGTAEIGGNLNNAWILGYAPAHIPEIAFAVVAERVEKHGGEVAGPILEKILKAYFSLRERREK